MPARRRCIPGAAGTYCSRTNPARGCHSRSRDPGWSTRTNCPDRCRRYRSSHRRSRIPVHSNCQATHTRSALYTADPGKEGSPHRSGMSSPRRYRIRDPDSRSRSRDPLGCCIHMRLARAGRSRNLGRYPRCIHRCREQGCRIRIRDLPGCCSRRSRGRAAHTRSPGPCRHYSHRRQVPDSHIRSQDPPGCCSRKVPVPNSRIRSRDLPGRCTRSYSVRSNSAATRM